MDLRDVSYYVKKKTGFPSITDMGVLDIFLGGTGFSFKIKLSTADKADRQNFFKVDKVDVDVKNFNIKVKQSKHKLLFTLVKSIMLKTMRPALQKILEKTIKDKVHELDTLAYEIKLEADRALQDVKENPDQASNIYSRYVTAAQKKLLQGKQKAESVASDKKVNMAVTKQDSLFPNLHLPGGISSKATEYKELANKGDSWESPVFKLGAAAPTKDLPSAPKVTRKDHKVTQGGVRNSQNREQSAGSYASTNSGTLSNGATGFGNHIDQAFGKDGTALPTSGNRQTAGLDTEKSRTFFGANNPVVLGSA